HRCFVWLLSPPPWPRPSGGVSAQARGTPRSQQPASGLAGPAAVPRSGPSTSGPLVRGLLVADPSSADPSSAGPGSPATRPQPLATDGHQWAAASSGISAGGA